MIKCRIDKEKDIVRIKTKGTGETINTELFFLIQQIYRGIRSQNESAAEFFRTTTIGVLLDPNSPVWKEEYHGEDH